MKTLGWILAIIGGITSTGALISMTKPDFVLNGVMFGSIITCVALLVIGIILIKKNK